MEPLTNRSFDLHGAEKKDQETEYVSYVQMVLAEVELKPIVDTWWVANWRIVIFSVDIEQVSIIAINTGRFVQLPKLRLIRIVCLLFAELPINRRSSYVNLASGRTGSVDSQSPTGDFGRTGCGC